MRVPRGGASCLGVGRPGSGALPPPTARPLGGLMGATTHWLWVRRGAGVGTRHQPHSARSCELALRAVGAARGRPGGAPPAWVWGVRGQLLSHPRLPALWAGCRGPLPTGCGCGGVRVWGPVTNPTARALAYCGGGMRVPRGGASCLGVGRPGSGALPPPTARPVGGMPGPTTHWLWVRGNAGVGTRHQSHSARSCELALRAVGAARGCPGGAPPAWVWGVRGRALSHPRLPAHLGGLPGPTTYWLWMRGGAGVGTRHQPHSARSCVLWGRHEGARGGRLLPGRGASGVGRSPTPDCLPSGRATGAHYPLALGAGGVRAWGPVTSPTARALASWLCALWGRHEGARGGASFLVVGRPGSGALPPPSARPLGGLPGRTNHWLWVRGSASVGTRHQPHSARSCVLWGRLEGARGGGASCLGVGRQGSGALPPPTARPLGGLPGPTTHWLWMRGAAGVGTRHQPHSAHSCELALRAVGAARGWPGGVPPAWVWGVRGRALSHPRLPALWAGCRGPLPTGCGCGEVRTWGPITNPTARALAYCGGGMRVPRGGASCLGVGRPGSGALPPPAARPLGGLMGATTHWLWVRRAAGVGTRHQPNSARSCGLALRAVGAARGRPGGAPPAWVWGVRGRSLSHPQLLALWAGCRGPLPTGCGCGGLRAWGPVTHPTARALAYCGGGMRVPRGGASCLGVGRPGSGALPAPAARPLGGLPGPTTHWLWVRAGAGVGTRHQPHSARSCELALRAVGAARGRPGGAPPAWVWGVRGPALSHPKLPALWAGCRGPLPTGCGCGEVRTWGPVTNPTARALAYCGGGMKVPRGGASCLGVGRPGSGALPPPTARPLGGLMGATTHWLWVRRGAGVGTRHQPHSARSCGLALRAVGAARGRPGGAPPAWVWGVRGRLLSHPRLPALWAGCRGPLPTGCGCGGVRAWGPVNDPTARALAYCGGGMRVPRGGASCLGVGRPGSGALPPPTARPVGGMPGPTTHWLWVRGDAGVGTRHQSHSARSCELALRAVGAARGCPGGAPPAWVWGVRGRALSHPRLPALWAGCRGPLPTGCGCGGVRAWGPVTNPTARALACCGGGMRVSGGAASCLGVGRPGLGALPPLTACPLGGLPGSTTHWLWVRGGAGVGTRHQSHSARSCELALRAVGAAGGRPGGRLLPGSGASGVGRSPTPECPPSGRAAGAH